MYKTSYIKLLLGCLFIYIFIVIMEVIVGLLFSLLLSVSVEQVQNNIIVYFSCVVISKLIVYIIARLLKYFIKPKNEKVSKLILIPFLVMPLSSIFVLYSLSTQIIISINEVDKIIIFVGALLLIISNLIVLFVFDMMLKQKEKQSTIENQLWVYELERKHQVDNIENREMANKTMHDFKNQLYAIKGILENDYDKGMAKIVEVCEIVETASSNEYTGIASVDALINSKVSKAKQLNISINTKSINIDGAKIDAVDLCIILGNILDNSIEACEKIKLDAKTVNLTIDVQGKYISITLENSVSNLDANNTNYTTSKRNKELHGYGLNNVKEIVEQYDGIIDYGITENRFILNLILNY